MYMYFFFFLLQFTVYIEIVHLVRTRVGLGPGLDVKKSRKVGSVWHETCIVSSAAFACRGLPNGFF